MRDLPDFAKGRILVVGDVMLDRFWHGATTRVSPEAPVPVVKVDDVDDRPGGAANVAANLAALGVQVTLAGLVGDDGYAKRLRATVEDRGVVWSVMPCDGNTIVKLRVLSRNQQLIRMDFEQPLSDYADDLFDQVEPIISACREANVPVLVDPKGTDFERYRGATLLTPNLSEFEAVVGACGQDSDLIADKACELCHSLDLDAMLVTRSEHGMTLQPKTGEALHLPAVAREVFDVTGAGDTVISALAAGLASNTSMAGATQIANVAAGLVVEKLGTAAVSREELEQALEGPSEVTPPQVNTGVVSENDLSDLVATLRSQGLRVVMTNGCFDLIHLGHVSYLSAAAELGDILIVAVNDDDSVRRLKGESRPVNGLHARSAVLAGLRSVDYVVAFSEDTPARLIERIAPDVLVKGGDYRVEEIAGHESVLKRGGEVVILDFVDGHSTTATIERISQQ
jgi:D-beta-D-heptose 7-phosphate kinase/D-beta-D-heptose 1-phosphate adenosyltransferase